MIAFLRDEVGTKKCARGAIGRIAVRFADEEPAAMTDRRVSVCAREKGRAKERRTERREAR